MVVCLCDAVVMQDGVHPDSVPRRKEDSEDDAGDRDKEGEEDEEGKKEKE